MSDIKVHVGTTIKEMGERFVDAWHRAEAGEDIHERHVSFESMDMLARTLTAKRIETIRALRREKAHSVRELAARLHRDVKNVHGDLKALVDAGIVDQDETGYHTDVTHIRTEIALF